MLQELGQDKNLYLYRGENAISVFDHVNYDRSDLDLLSEAQRTYAFRKISKYGYKQHSGRTFKSKERQETFTIPKQSIIAASPIQIAKAQKLRPHEIFIFTPTQMACFILVHSDQISLIDSMKELISKQPVNLKKILDHVRLEPQRERYEALYPQLSAYQEHVIETTELKHRNHLGKIF